MVTTVGVFSSEADAESAVNELSSLNLREDSIRVLKRGNVESGSWLGSLANAFTSGDNALTSELSRLGLSREEAHFYDEEVENEGVLVVVRADDDLEPQILDIMERANGVTHT